MKSKARICVPVCVSRAGELAGAIRRAAEVAEIIELRLDYLLEHELAQASGEITAVLKSRQQPMILTLRPAEYGGARAISVEDRLFCRINEVWASGSRNGGADFWDLELDLALLLQRTESEGNDPVELGLCDWARTICSYHDFVGVPSDLEQIYESMASTRARILKIAVQADDATDCLPIFRLLARAQREGREMIAIAMGQPGVMTRILGPSRGSYLTYGSLDEDSATAPGQLTARELRDVYRIDEIDRQTKVTGLIGKPVRHSLSPNIHNAAFARAKANAVFIPFEVHDLNAFVRRMVREESREIDWNLRGFSVTAPHKTRIKKHLDWIDPIAQDIGAVNTIVIEKGVLRGYNTDAQAFIQPLNDHFESLAGSRCAIIGAGGAARSVIWALRRAGATVTLFARDLQKATPITQHLAIECRHLAEAGFAGFDIVINATPLGTCGLLEDEAAARAEALRGVRLAYDLVYNPSETRFIREARAAGCETIGGLEMLIAQAVEQFKYWTGLQPDIDAMRSAASRQ